MKAIYLKELRSYFSSVTGYLVIGMFLLITSLFLFVFNGEFNLLDYGFADLSPFFLLAPWLFLFLIPAITMRGFTTERHLGTLEMIVTRPISFYQIIAGKYLAAISLIVIALVPTLLYVITVGVLGETSFNLDLGSTTGSYLGLLLVAFAYTAIGIFCSIVTSNQVAAFLLAAGICFMLYYGFEGIAGILTDQDWVAQLGMQFHYESIARGVIDTRDVIYFLSITVFFFALSEKSLKTIIQKS